MNILKIITNSDINTIEVIIHELNTELPVDVHREKREEVGREKWKLKFNGCIYTDT